MSSMGRQEFFFFFFFFFFWAHNFLIDKIYHVALLSRAELGRVTSHRPHFSSPLVLDLEVIAVPANPS